MSKQAFAFQRVQGHSLRIGLIMQSLRMGGLEELVVRLADAYKQRGHAPEVIAYEDGPLHERLRSMKIPVHYFDKPDGYIPSFSLQLAELFRQRRFDVLHTHHFNPLIYTVPGAMMTGTSLIHTMHSREHLPPERAKHRLMFAALASCSETITTVNEELKSFLAREFSMADNQVEVIRNGVDAQTFHGQYDKDAIRRELGLHDNAPVIGIVARLEPEKDHSTLLAAMSMLHRPAHLLVIGDGTQRERLEQRARKVGLNDHVHFLGARSDIPQLLSALDVFVLSSTREGLPLALLEAMSSGIPAVVSDVGGMPKVVKESGGGGVFPAKTPHALASELNGLLRRPDLARHMGTQAQRWVQRAYGQDAMVEHYLDVYQRSLRAKFPARSMRFAGGLLKGMSAI